VAIYKNSVQIETTGPLRFLAGLSFCNPTAEGELIFQGFILFNEVHNIVKMAELECP
jgi:hypothetical protein